MANKASPLDIMNLMGQAAQKKASMSGQQATPDDEEDPLNSKVPTAAKSPASKKSGKVAAIKEQEKQSGKAVPPAPSVKGM